MEVANKSIWITSIHCATGKIIYAGTGEWREWFLGCNISKSWRSEPVLNGHNVKYKT